MNSVVLNDSLMGLPSVGLTIGTSPVFHLAEHLFNWGFFNNAKTGAYVILFLALLFLILTVYYLRRFILGFAVYSVCWVIYRLAKTVTTTAKTGDLISSEWVIKTFRTVFYSLVIGIVIVWLYERYNSRFQKYRDTVVEQFRR